MHPVVIMAHEKSEALDAAKKSLEEAGMKVKILMTGSAKMVDFLGALADVEDEPADETPAEQPEGSEEAEVKPEGGEEGEAEEKPKMEAIVNGEKVDVELINGETELHPNSLIPGNKTAYSINESLFSFWKSDVNDMTHEVQIQVGDVAEWTRVIIKEARERPLLKLNRQIFEMFSK